MTGPVPSPAYVRIYRAVDRIPRGRVATYGQIAHLCGLPGHARQVGYAMNTLPEGSATPWQRVINAQGRVSTRALAGTEECQERLLRREGVAFDGKGRISLERFGWRPR